MLYKSSNTVFPLAQSILLTCTMLPSMTDPFSTLTQKIIQICYLPATVTSSNKLWVYFFYYVIALNNTLLVALNDISLEQSKATDNTSKKITKLLN